MTIIKQGNQFKREDEPIEGSCHNCGAIFTERWARLRWIREPHREPVAQEKCPCCREIVYFYDRPANGKE